MSVPTQQRSSAAKAALQRTTRRLTGLPSWPILLIAGVPKAGKTWSAAEASASDLIGAAYWITVGENDPDEYAPITGTNFDVVSHDGSFEDIIGAIRWASAQPQVDGKPTLIVIDSISRVWEILSARAQDEANARRDRKLGKASASDEEAVINSDLWNRAADRHGDLFDAIRDHRGPVILTALMDEVTVFENDKPTKNKTWKITGHRSLPGAVTAIVEMPARGSAWMSGVVSYRMKVPERRKFPNFTVDAMWRQMGLAETQVGERHHQRTVSAAPDDGPRTALINEVAAAADGAGIDRTEVVRLWAESHQNQHIKDATDVGGLELLRDDLLAQSALRQNGKVPA